MAYRLEKVSQNISKEAGKALGEEFDFPNGVLVTVVRSSVSRTLEHCTVYLSVMPKNLGPKILNQISSRIYSLQQVLNKKLAVRPVPKIRFELEDSYGKIEKIQKILEQK